MDAPMYRSRFYSVSDTRTYGLADYDYLGANMLITSQWIHTSLRYYLPGLGNEGLTGSGFVGLDAFDRVVDPRWRNTVNLPTVTTVDEIKYGYDFASNRTWREHVQDSTNSFDWFYANDGINRLDEAQRGQLNGSYTGLSTKKAAQDCALDAVSNWRTFKQDVTGGGGGGATRKLPSHGKSN